MNQLTTRTDERSSPKKRGQRIRRLRNMANFSRKELQEKYAININTLKGWELGRHGGLSKKGALKMLKLLEEKGVVCDFNWLMFGIGNGPRIQQVFIVEEKEAHYELLPESMEEKQIISELEHFRSLHENSIDLVITDDTMRPFYEEGELVAGINRFKNRLKSAIGLNCIVQTKDGKVLLRRVQEGTETGRFILTSLNTQTQSPDAILYNVELISAAPVIWRRRKNPKIA